MIKIVSISFKNVLFICFLLFMSLTLSTHYNTLVNKGGYMLLEEENMLVFVKQRRSFVYILKYILFLFALLFSCNGIAQLLSKQVESGVIILIIGILLWLGYILMSRYLKNHLNIDASQIVAAIDLGGKNLLNSEGINIAPLEKVTFYCDMQLFSSARALWANWPGGGMVIVRGSPFTGGIKEFVSILQEKGLM